MIKFGLCARSIPSTSARSLCHGAVKVSPGGNSRAWLLTIVRNTCYTWLQQNRADELATEFDEELHSVESENPEMILLENANKQLLKQALEKLPPEFREAVILRELEGLSYKEIAVIADVPVGTVRSRLRLARKTFREALERHRARERFSLRMEPA